MRLADHLEGLRTALLAFGRYAGQAGPAARVPTTPDWTVRQLVAHQGMVHRWAAATVRGEHGGGREGDQEPWEQEGLRAADQLDWLQEGAIDLAAALTGAPADLDVFVFLADAPPAREFWARRQCHETTIHAVDALAAVHGRLPRAADASWIADEVALDGIDELLTGFLPRPRSRLRSEDPQRILVRPDTGDRAWLLEVGSSIPRSTRTDRTADVAADVVLAGGPVALYLTLWNRSDEVSPTDDWSLWLESAQVRWS